MKISLDHFRKFVLPSFQADSKSPEELQGKVEAFLKDTEVTDAEGAVIDVKHVVMELKQSGQIRDNSMSPDDLKAFIASTVSEALKNSLPQQTKAVRGEPADKQLIVPGKALRFGGARYLRGDDQETGNYKAYRLGQFLLAANGNQKAAQWMTDHAMPLQKAYIEGTNIYGGYLVPEQIDNDLIRLVLEYGVFRRNARIVPMTSDTAYRRRRTGGLTAYFVGENAAGTESTGTWDRVNLVAKKLMVLSLISNELNEDSVISIADNFAMEAAYALAYKEDLCGFSGTGTSTYGGIHGIIDRLAVVNEATYGTVDDGGGMTVGAAWGSITLAHFHTCMSRLPGYARNGAKWYCSPTFWDSQMNRLAFAAGGVTATEIVNGIVRPNFLGHPVELTEIMPTATALSQICALFGNMALAADFGDRRSTTVAFSDSATVGSTNAFESDDLAARVTERFDINVHDVGTSTAGGPVVCLTTAAS